MSDPNDMNKRTELISIRVTPELEADLRALAADGDTTVSSIGFTLLLEFRERKREEYLKLKRVFGDDQGILGRTVDVRDVRG